MRNSTEQSQLELYNLARSKKYYVPAKHAPENEVVEMKTTLENMKCEKCRTTLQLKKCSANKAERFLFSNGYDWSNCIQKKQLVYEYKIKKWKKYNIR